MDEIKEIPLWVYYNLFIAIGLFIDLGVLRKKKKNISSRRLIFWFLAWATFIVIELIQGFYA